MPAQYLAMRNSFKRKGMSDKAAKTKAAKIYNAKHKKHPVTRYGECQSIVDAFLNESRTFSRPEPSRFYRVKYKPKDLDPVLDKATFDYLDKTTPGWDKTQKAPLQGVGSSIFNQGMNKLYSPKESEVSSHPKAKFFFTKEGFKKVGKDVLTPDEDTEKFVVRKETSKTTEPRGYKDNLQKQLIIKPKYSKSIERPRFSSKSVDVDEFSNSVHKYLNEMIKLNLNQDTNKWLPVSDLEKSIKKETGERPKVMASNEYPTSYGSRPVKKQIKFHSARLQGEHGTKGTWKNTPKLKAVVNLNPSELKDTAGLLNIPLKDKIQTAVAHELGHKSDFENRKVDWHKEVHNPDKEDFKNELHANREGEKLLKKHNLPPMNKLSKKFTLATHHADILAKKASSSFGEDPETQSKNVHQYLSYTRRLSKQGIKL